MVVNVGDQHGRSGVHVVYRALINNLLRCASERIQLRSLRDLELCRQGVYSRLRSGEFSSQARVGRVA